MSQIAVVIVNYNSGLLLEKCLQHLSDQTRRPDRVIIVDNASTEADSHGILKSISNAEVILLEENIGYGAAINRALQNLDGFDYVCCLNPDAFPRPDWLEKLAAAAAANPAFGSFASLQLRAGDESIVDGAGDDLHFTGIPWRRHHGHRLEKLNITTGPAFSACGGAAMYRCEAIRKLGGFDESLFMYIEDVDLGFRLQLAGYPCLLVKEAIVAHVGSAITGERSEFSSYHGHRNLVYSYFKNMPLMLLLLTLPFHVLANLVTILVFALRGSPGVLLRAKWDGIKRIPAAVKARRDVVRAVPVYHIWHLLQKLPIPPGLTRQG